MTFFYRGSDYVLGFFLKDYVGQHSSTKSSSSSCGEIVGTVEENPSYLRNQISDLKIEVKNYQFFSR